MNNKYPHISLHDFLGGYFSLIDSIMGTIINNDLILSYYFKVCKEKWNSNITFNSKTNTWNKISDIKNIFCYFIINKWIYHKIFPFIANPSLMNAQMQVYSYERKYKWKSIYKNPKGSSLMNVIIQSGALKWILIGREGQHLGIRVRFELTPVASTSVLGGSTQRNKGTCYQQ